MKTVAGVFSSMQEALRAGDDLEQIGVPSKSINVIAGNDANQHDHYLKKAERASTSTAGAAASAASTGGGIGIVATLIALSIPGVGPLIAGGALATIAAGMLVGAAGGGLIGAFVEMGISHEEAPLYEEAVKRGAIILAVHVDDPMEEEALEILIRRGSRDIREVHNAVPHPEVFDDSIRNQEPAETIEVPEVGSARAYPYTPKE